MKYRTQYYAEGVFDCYFFEKNLQGDIVAVYDADGTRIGAYVYDAWGNVKVAYGSNNYVVTTLNPFRYRGYYYDVETGLYYLQSRYYNPSWGRFLNVDACLYNNILGFNMFAYCYNNPVNYIDPYGESAKTLFWGWLSSGWGAALAEPTIVGEIIYVGGCVILGGIALVETIVLADMVADAIKDATDTTPESTTSKPEDQPKESEGETEKDRPNSLPPNGEPNSDQELHDKDGLKQKRHYGPDGKAEYDIDYRHPNPDGSHTFPHKHNWDWTKTPPRGEGIPIFPSTIP